MKALLSFMVSTIAQENTFQCFRVYFGAIRFENMYITNASKGFEGKRKQRSFKTQYFQ